MADNNNVEDILAEAEAEVAAETNKKNKDLLKTQIRKVAAAREVLANEERQLEVLKRSIVG